MAALVALAGAARTGGAADEQARANALVQAWARTGSCHSALIAGRCGVIVAIVDGQGGAPTVAQAAAGGGTSAFGLGTLFEIASNSKVLTAVTFQRHAAQGLVSENETLAAFLPKSLQLRNASVGTVTMRELLSHTSGLARLPTNLHGTPQNQFTGYTQADLYTYLANVSSLPTRGSFLYSNLAFGLLGHLLELRGGASGPGYESIVRESLLEPLGMRDTVITLSKDAWARLVAPGLNKRGNLTERSTPYGVLKGQGAFHSSIRDMAAFLSAHLRLHNGGGGGLPPTLSEAMRTALEPIAVDEYVPQVPPPRPALQPPKKMLRG